VTGFADLLSRLVQKLLEQPAQLERRALAAVGHNGRRGITRAIDLPLANRHAAQSWIALRSTLAALSLLPSDPALALARQQLPAGTRARTRPILERDETSAVASDDVETTIICGLIERAAHGEAPAVAAGDGEAHIQSACDGGCPVSRLAWKVPPSWATTSPAYGLWRPQLDERQLARRSLLAPRA
jgi:hypothetical protein